MRTKKSVIIFLTDVIPLAILSIIGIFKLKIFLQVLGDETLGLYQLFNQIMIYIALVDGGLVSAVLHSLYKPNSEKDDKKVYSLLLGARKAFALIGCVVFALAAVIAFIVPFLIKDNSFAYFYVVIAFIIYSLSNVFQYFFVPSRVCLEVKEKKYIVNLITQVGQIIQGALEITMLLCGATFIKVLIMHSIIKLLSSVLIAYICNKKYKNPYKNLKPDYSFVKQLKHLIFHKINGLVGSNIDVIIISKFLGLVSVAVYSTYVYIYNMIHSILGKFSSSITAIVGNLMAKDKNGAYKLFNELNNMMYFTAIVICVPLALAISGFIDIWYEKTIQTNIMIGFSFALLLFVNILKQPTITFVTAGGLFKETKYCALTDTIVNLTLSLLLVFKLGIHGVIVATAISVFISEDILKTRVIFKNIFNKKMSNLIVNNIKFFVIAALDFVIGFLIIRNIAISNIFVWFGVFTVYFVINAACVLFVFYLLKSSDFISRMRVLLKKSK